ncbi:hypothetical protein Q8A67_007261 [Cirrhinus molitorella]|uniref:Uncharacterized protein n=1 Tax=Cirrhinus molitorella TaxID=172907 RepID=A0AA88Q3I8_9TELE|nr:hypothetical protein Q8A67_007261 [Cirrhinus molitorella]
MAITVEAEKAAREALFPPYPLKTGEDDDIITYRNYLSLQGKIEKVEVARMTRAQVPILDMSIKCGSRLYEIALWRDEALTELYNGDIVEITHLKATTTPGGKRKSVSSNYTTVKSSGRHVTQSVYATILAGKDSRERI